MSYILKTQLNPNREIRTTLYSAPKKRVTLREEAAQFLDVPSEAVERRASSNPDSKPLLDIRSEFKTATIKCSAHQYSRTEFGRSAKTRIMRACGALDQHDASPWHYLFLTATLPANSDWAKWAIANESGWIINTFKAWLSKRLQNRLEFYVWENQKRGALHFHYCIHVADVDVRRRIAEEFRLEWMRLLDGVQERTGINMWGRFANLSGSARYCIVQTNVQEVTRSVGAYMAGYCSNEKNKHSQDNVMVNFPKRWFGVSRPLSDLIKQFSEEETVEYPNYRTAKIAFDDLSENFSQENLTGRIYPHKIGRGETSVFYHEQKVSRELWESRKTMRYQKSTHPNISFLIKRVLLCTQMISALMKESQLFREIFSKLPLESLRDGLYQDSLRRGSLHVSQIQAIEILWLSLSSRSSLPQSLRQLSTALRQCIQSYSQNYQKVEWNRHGWLSSYFDFDPTVDSAPEICEDGTNSADEGTSLDPDSSRGHVPSEPKSSSTQLELI